MKKLFFLLLLCASVIFFTSGEEMLSYLDGNSEETEKIENVTHIGKWAFAYNALKTVKIPEGITLIGEGAFANNELSELKLPAAVQTIENWAFANNKISSIVFPAETVYIGDNAFLGNDITDITIGSLVYISKDAINDAFYGCYLDSGRKSGRYIMENGKWKKL